MPPYNALPESLIPGQSLNHSEHHAQLHKYYNYAGNKSFVESKDAQIAVTGTALASPIKNLALNPKMQSFLAIGSTPNYVGLKSIYTGAGGTSGYVASTDSPSGGYLWVKNSTEPISAVYLTDGAGNSSAETPRTQMLSVVPGDTFTINTWIKTTGTAGTSAANPHAKVRYTFRTSTGAVITGFNESPVKYLTNKWELYSDTTIPAPAGAAYLGITREDRFRVDGAAASTYAGWEIQYGGLVVEKNVNRPAPYYFDGDTISGSWDGTANQSSSTLRNLKRMDAGEFTTQGNHNMVVVNHGSVASTPRPLGIPAGAVHWVGTVVPTNANPLDTKRISGMDYTVGVGMPNGVLSAPVGTVYTDSNVTNGALTWVKRTGIGNTGWVVSNADTGWRDITSSLINGWTATEVLVRRVNSTMYLHVIELVQTAATATAVIALPVGFRPGISGRQNYRVQLTATNGIAASAIYNGSVGNSDSVLYANTPRGAGTPNLNVEESFTNVDAWPTTLPGTAV